MISQTMIDLLIKQAVRKTWEEGEDDFNPYDYSGGNYDDAYYGGCNDGQTYLARDILTELGISWS